MRNLCAVLVGPLGFIAELREDAGDHLDASVPEDFARDIAPGVPYYRLIYTSPDSIWLARTRDNNIDPLVAMIPRDQITLLRLYPAQGNCSVGGI
jgi:hypothetical protein